MNAGNSRKLGKSALATAALAGSAGLVSLIVGHQENGEQNAEGRSDVFRSSQHAEAHNAVEAVVPSPAFPSHGASASHFAPDHPKAFVRFAIISKPSETHTPQVKSNTIVLDLDAIKESSETRKFTFEAANKQHANDRSPANHSSEAANLELSLKPNVLPADPTTQTSSATSAPDVENTADSQFPHIGAPKSEIHPAIGYAAHTVETVKSELQDRDQTIDLPKSVAPHVTDIDAHSDLPPFDAISPAPLPDDKIQSIRPISDLAAPDCPAASVADTSHNRLQFVDIAQPETHKQVMPEFARGGVAPNVSETARSEATILPASLHLAGSRLGDISLHKFTPGNPQIRLGDLVSLFSKELEPDSVARFNNAQMMDAYVSFDQMKASGLDLSYDEASGEIHLSLGQQAAT